MQALAIFGIPVVVGVVVGYLFTLPVATAMAAVAFLAGVILLITSNGIGLAGLLNVIVGIPLLIGAVVAGITILLVNNVFGLVDLHWLLRV